jgi:putative polyhydroxyalkanoate system protein
VVDGGDQHDRGMEAAPRQKMGTIHIQKPHHLGREEAHRRVEKLEPELKDKYGVQLHWHGDRADVKASRVSGQLVVDDSQLSIDLKLGLPLVLVQGKIRSSLEQQLARALA